jgi:raffinose/stachyose/melibiose transport system permease protein
LNNFTYDTQKRIVIFTFLLLPVLLLLTFSYYPALMLIYYSFTNWNGLSPGYKFVGMSNYIEVLSNPEIFSVFRNNMYYFIGGLLQTAIALYFAVILNGKLKARNFFRVILFLPYILHSVAIAIMFQSVYHATQGSLNLLLEAIGLPSWKQNWLGNRTIVDYALAFVSLWKFMGLSMVIFIGALQSIPEDLYEASKIDGANSIQDFIYITLPSIRSVIELLLILTLSGALQAFEIPYVMTLGANDTQTFVMKTVEVAFRFNQSGLASAMAVVLLIIVLVIIAIEKQFVTKERN